MFEKFRNKIKNTWKDDDVMDPVRRVLQCQLKVQQIKMSLSVVGRVGKWGICDSSGDMMEHSWDKTGGSQ